MIKKVLMRVYAALLTMCIVITSAGFLQVLKVYAEDGGDFFEDNWDDFQDDDPDPEPTPDPPEPDPPAPTPDPPAPETDPFDYDLACYTPSISFGAVNYDDVVYAKQFNIVNIGSTTFPLTWEEVDTYTAFDVGRITASEYMNPGDTVSFSVAPRSGLAPGTYTARLIFYSADDIRRHHTATVDLAVTVLDATPYITEVEVIPNAVTLPVGKTYQFSSAVGGGNNYNSDVTWSLSGNKSQSTFIDQYGNLTVGSNETAGSFVVFCTSKQDPSFVDRAVVTVARVDHLVSVSASPSEGGAVAGGGSVTDGGSVNVSASANNNYSFDGWYEGNSLISTSRSFTLSDIRSDRKLVAKFNRNSCYVKTSVNDADAGTVTKSSSVSYGGKMTITAKANNGYRFKGFVENKKTISESTSLELNNITSDRDITAVFERITCKVTVYVSPADAGKFTGAGNYYKGTNAELTTVPFDGYDFTGWTINGQVVSTDRRLVISNISSDVNVTANYIKKNSKTYKIVSGIANEGGNISPSGNSQVAEGGSITYNIIPASGYKILAVAVDGKNIGAVASYTFNNVKGDHSIAAAFEKKTAESKTTGNAATSSASSSKTSGASAKKAQDQAPAQAKTEFSKETAAKGAVKESEVIIDEESVATETTVLTGEEYAEDTYTEAAEVPVTTDSNVNADTVMAKHDLDEDTLRFLIKDKAVRPLLKEAYESGVLKITVNNSYANDTQETAVALYYNQPTLKNFEEVIEDSMSEEEVYAVLNGKPISYNIEISENTATIDSNLKKLMQSKVGYKPFTYFDFSIMKTSDGTTSLIENTAKDLEVEVKIPKEYLKKGRKFVVIRNHNGTIDVLDNIGTGSDSITFKTDRFSQYAIAYETVSVNRLLIIFVVVGLISFVLAVVCYINLIKYRRRARRK